MKDIVIFGSGGMALETVQLIEDINEVEPTWNLLGFIDDYRGAQAGEGTLVSGYPILGTREIVGEFGPSTYWVIGVSNTQDRREIHDALARYNLNYATLIHPTVKRCKNVTIGEGTIVSYGCILSVNVVLGSQVYLNMRTIVGHDTVIRDYATCLIGCIIAGDVLVCEGALLGSNCVIREKKTIGANTKISMGSVVYFDVEDNVVVMNRPPKSIKFYN